VLTLSRSLTPVSRCCRDRFDKLIYLSVSEDNESQLKIMQALTRKYVRLDSPRTHAGIVAKLVFPFASKSPSVHGMARFRLDPSLDLRDVVEQVTTRRTPTKQSPRSSAC
jgi:hypothetical protein